MYRLLFEKSGKAVWISHLDLMRVFQRAFMRADLPLTHTQGFNPRPSVSIALPLSVGASSQCELLDFDLEGERVACEEILDRLNRVLIDGVSVREVYQESRKLKDLSYLQCQIKLEYDAETPENICRQIENLFGMETVMVPKKTKNNGIQDQNIVPMIRQIVASRPNPHVILLDCVICCQNPSLNPAQIVSALELYLPELKPDFSSFRRMEIMDQNMNVFR